MQQTNIFDVIIKGFDFLKYFIDRLVLNPINSAAMKITKTVKFTIAIWALLVFMLIAEWMLPMDTTVILGFVLMAFCLSVAKKIHPVVRVVGALIMFVAVTYVYFPAQYDWGFSIIKKVGNEFNKSYATGEDIKNIIYDQHKKEESEREVEASKKSTKEEMITVYGKDKEELREVNYKLDSIDAIKKEYKEDKVQESTYSSHPLTYERTFSPSGTRETLYFCNPGETTKTSIIYLRPGQRIRVYASTDCKIYSSKLPVTPRTWESYDQTVEGLIPVEGVGKKGKIDIEVM